jgi:hypothetical protein
MAPKYMGYAMQTADPRQRHGLQLYRRGQGDRSPPKTQMEMSERLACKEFEKVDFYLARRSL